MIVYEGAVSAEPRGGARYHFTGLAAALSRNEAVARRLCVMVPRFRGSLPLEFPGDIVVVRLRVPRRGYVSHALYELRKIFALLRLSLIRRGTEPQPILVSRIAPIGVAAIIAPTFGFRVFLEVNGLPDDESAARAIHGIRLAIIRWLVSLQLRRCEGAVCVTEGLRDAVTERGVRRACRVENGVDLSAIPLELAARPGDDHLIAYSGALAPWQEIDILLRALAFLRGWEPENEWRLLVVGDGEGREALHRLAQDLDVDSAVEWMGWVSREESFAAVVRAATAVVPLRPKSESGICGSPLKLFEYLALRRIVVAADIDGINELTDYALRTYPQGNPEALAHEIKVAGESGTSWNSPVELSWDDRAARIVRFVLDQPGQ